MAQELGSFKMVSSIVKTERGAVFIEAAIAIPILLFVLFQGYELTRLAELQLVKRDIIRVLSLAKTCTTKQSDAGLNCSTNDDGTVTCVGNQITPARVCLDNVVGEVKEYTTKRFENFQVYVQAYSVYDDPDTEVDERQSRLATYCPSGEGAGKNLSQMPVLKVVETERPAKFANRYGFTNPNSTTGFVFAGGGKGNSLLHDSLNMDIALQLCRTGSIYIVEYTLGRKPAFSLELIGLFFKNKSDEDKNEEVNHYEVGVF